MISTVLQPFRPVVRIPRRAGLIRGGLFALSLLGAHLAPAQTGGIESQPLAGRSGPRGATMFATLTPEQTGMVTVNRYADPRMWNELYHEFEIGAIGTGVAIGDVDNDGRPDVLVVSKVESARLFRNLGGFKFEDVTNKAGVADPGEAGGAWKQGAAMADVNNDGWLDLYVCRFRAPNLLYVNQGDGTFKEAAAAHGLAVNDATSMAAFCDYDHDGWLDVYIQTNLLDNSRNPAGQRDHLFRNNGDGTFSNVSDRAGISSQETQGHAATWWDYNNDGWPDLYVANDFAVPDFLYRNNGDGTFTNVINEVVPHMSYSSMGADLGDLNNDGLIDFLVADMAATTHQKDQRTMADTRARTRDLRDDDPAPPNYLRNALYLNTGSGRVQEAAYLTGLAATDWTWSVRFEDLDNDGRLDVHVTNGMHREIHNTDLLTRMMTAESAIERIRIARSGPVLKEANLAYRNLGDLRFEPIASAWGLDQRGVSFGAAFGDLDGDGDLDLVYTNFEAGVSVLRNDSDRGHRIIIGLRGNRSNRHGVGSTVRLETAAGGQVRQLVLARGYMSTSEPVIHFGLGDEATVSRLEVSWPSGHKQVFENLAADRRYTVTEPSRVAPPEGPAQETVALFEEVSQSGNLSWVAREEAIDEIAQQRLLPTRFNRRGPSVTVGDINGDRKDDILMGGTTRDETRILFGSAAGRYAELKLPKELTGGTVNDGPALIFDANGDGRNDLFLTKGGNSQPAGAPDYQPRLLLNSGSGLQPAAPGVVPAVSISAGAVAAADFDRDGQPDVFIGARLVPNQYPETPRSVLLANRDGKFVDVTEALAPGLREVGLVTAALWSDVDGDGWVDLVLALEWGHAKYFRNREGQGFEDRTEAAGFAAAGTGWWQSLAPADFNGDGRPDFAVGNVGLNTPYHATPEAPTLLFYGEFREGAGPLVVEAYHEGGKIYPRRSRKDLGAAIPSVLQKFQRNDFYARATLGEILGEAKLAQAQRLAATELRSGVFLSQPDGRYQFSALPVIVQVAPLSGLVAGDFDGDGQADLYAVQNSYAPAPVVGRFDGGLSQLLRGDGRGGFVAVPPAQSGLVVPGDAKAVVVLDLDADGRPDFLVSRNQGTTLAFRNKGRR